MTNQTDSRRCRIGIDVGGTFTDFVLADVTGERLTYYKEPSIPADPSAAVARGIAGVLERAGMAPDNVDLVVHGTTLAVNAIIQRRGARIGLVVSRGNRDVLEIARCRMPNSYDFRASKEEPLIPRDLIFEVSARTRADGTRLSEASDSEIDELAGRLRHADVAAVAVMLLHSYAHPAEERRVAAALRKRLPDVLVSESAEIWPEIREYERALVALLNAYVHPLMNDYLRRLTERLHGLGIGAPVYITTSNGGTSSLESAADRPIDTLLSGPASGVVAATSVASDAARRQLITFDMGGTSSDIALVKEGEPEYSTQTHVGEFPLVLPVVDVSSIGAGGGSIVWVDRQGVLKVGPESAGADPGPVCYGRGGTEPTVTDCYLLIGCLDPAHFLGGRMPLDRDAAVRALEGIAERLGMEGDERAVEAAEAALRVATAVMATELYKGLAQRGEDPAAFTLMPFGGAGPTHANLLAEEARLRAILVPPAPSTFCAMGAILADVKRDYIRTLRLSLRDSADAGSRLADAFRSMQGEAAAWIGQEGELLGETTFTANADMRYAGQAFELTVDLPEALRAAPDPKAFADLLHQAHERIYGFREPEAAVEVTVVRLRVAGRMPPLPRPQLRERKEVAAMTNRRVYHGGGYLDVAVYRRADLGEGARLSGPAVIEQEDSTTWMLPGWSAVVDRFGNLLLEPS